MLSLAVDPTFSASVAIPLPSGETATIECKFRYIPTTKLADFLKEAASQSGPGPWWYRLLAHLKRLPWVGKFIPLKARRGDAEYLLDVVAGWSGVDLEFSPESAARLCEMYPHAAALIVKTWATELTKLRLGN